MYARVGLKGGGRMKHQKEWRTCDRCGKEIIRYDEKYAYIKTREVKPLHEKSICTAEVLAKEVFPMAIWRDDMYDLLDDYLDPENEEGGDIMSLYNDLSAEMEKNSFLSKMLAKEVQTAKKKPIKK